MSEMSILRRGPSSPAAAPPLEDENLLAEILLRLPPEPSSLPRASAVCNRWRGLVSDARFTRRFRIHHRRNPPLLGFFNFYRGISFDPTLEAFNPTLEAPNRVAPGRFSLQLASGDVLRPLGCRDGLVLMLDSKRKQALVWDPVTGDQHRIALPPLFDAVDPLPSGAVLRAAGDVHFQVVLVATDDDQHARVFACVYSSETGLWGNLISTSLVSTNRLNPMPAVLVGDSLYWHVFGELINGILEFDLERQSLAVIEVPMDIDSEDQLQFMVIRADGGGLGLLFLLLSKEEDLGTQLWKRKTDCDGVASWELGRTIELDKLLSLGPMRKLYCSITGFAECNSVVFLQTFGGVFMVELESLRFKKVSEARDLFCCMPFESVYAAGI